MESSSSRFPTLTTTRCRRVSARFGRTWKQSADYVFWLTVMKRDIFCSSSPSLLNHIQRPTQVLRVQDYRVLDWQPEEQRQLRHRHFRTHQFPGVRSMAADREPVLFNNDVALSVAAPSIEDQFFYRNAQGDEV